MDAVKKHALDSPLTLDLYYLGEVQLLKLEINVFFLYKGHVNVMCLW